MGKFILGRFAVSLGLLFIVSVIVFLLLEMLPGDPAATILGENATPDTVAALRQDLGLNQPVAVRYFDWLGGVVRGDLGSSLFTSYEVSRAIGDRAVPTLSLVGLSLCVSVAIGVPLGVLAGWRSGSVLDRVLTVGASIGLAVPVFWSGVVLALIFGLRWELLPATGWVAFGEDPLEWFRHLVLPTIALSMTGLAEIARQTRAGLIDVLQRDFIRTSYAGGLPESSVVGKHALKNSMIPIITVVGLQVSRLFGLTILVEQVFNIPGLGTLFIEAVFKRDVTMIQGITLILSAIVIFVNFLVDISYGWFNPKVSMS